MVAVELGCPAFADPASDAFGLVVLLAVVEGERDLTTTIAFAAEVEGGALRPSNAAIARVAETQAIATILRARAAG